MKIIRRALLAAVAIASIAVPAADAQVLLGLHGTLADVGDVSPGIGGSVTFFRQTAGDLDLGLDVSGTFYFPSCSGSECDAWGTQAMLVGVQPLSNQVRPYAGVGAKYVDVNGSSGGIDFSGDSWGFAVLLGSSYQTSSALRPYFELGWSFMDSASDIWEFRLGLRTALSGGR